LQEHNPKSPNAAGVKQIKKQSGWKRGSTCFGSPIRGNLRLLSAHICVNRLTNDPALCGSFDVRAGFGTGI